MKLNLSVSPLSLAAMLPSLAALLWYAWKVWRRQFLPTTYASFLMWMVMDVLLVVNAIRTFQSIWMQLGFTIGATAVTCVLWKRGERTWGSRETFTAICAGLSIGATYFMEGASAQFWTVLAMDVAGIPILLDNLKNPVWDSFPMWFTTVISCVLQLYGSDWKTWDPFVVPLMCGSYNALMALVVLRGRKASIHIQLQPVNA